MQLLEEKGEKLIVGVGDAKVSNDPRKVLATFSLGSCVGVTLYDPATRVGGLLHYQLPSAKADPERAKEKPLMFADTGMAWMMQKMRQYGAEIRRARIRIAGAADMLNDHNIFDIGRRNHTAIRKILWQHGLFVESEHVGGAIPRTLFLNLADGALVIRSGREEIII